MAAFSRTVEFHDSKGSVVARVGGIGSPTSVQRSERGLAALSGGLRDRIKWQQAYATALPDPLLRFSASVQRTVKRVAELLANNRSAG